MSSSIVKFERLDEVMTLGKVMAESGYFQDTRSISQAVVKMLAGRELGISPIAAMTGIYIVKGRVTLSANIMAGLVKASGRYDYRILQNDDTGCVLEFYEGGKPVGKSEFSIQDAQKAGLANGDNWKKYPRNMLFSRALSNGVKWFCPDITNGPVYTPDELGEEIDGETGEIINYRDPEPVIVEIEPEPEVKSEPATPKKNGRSQPEPTNGNGGGKIGGDATSQFWYYVRSNKIDPEAARSVADECGGDFEKALNVLMGATDMTPPETEQNRADWFDEQEANEAKQGAFDTN